VLQKKKKKKKKKNGSVMEMAEKFGYYKVCTD
jgi:hypothetical protein